VGYRQHSTLLALASKHTGIGRFVFDKPTSRPILGNSAGPPDRDRINVHEAYEVQYWSKKVGVTPEQLKAAGTSAKAVEAHLKGQKRL